VAPMVAMTMRLRLSPVTRGFRQLPRVSVDDATLNQWQGHILRVTTGYTQAVQEYCEQLAYICEDSGWMGLAAHLDRADAARGCVRD
jgi:hypothetical protein